MLVEARHRLSVGRAPEIAALIVAKPRKAPLLIHCLWDSDPGVVNRAADALERASRGQPSILEPWRASLLGLLTEARENKLR